MCVLVEDNFSSLAKTKNKKISFHQILKSKLENFRESLTILSNVNIGYFLADDKGGWGMGGGRKQSIQISILSHRAYVFTIDIGIVGGFEIMTSISDICILALSFHLK